MYKIVILHLHVQPWQSTVDLVCFLRLVTAVVQPRVVSVRYPVLVTLLIVLWPIRLQLRCPSPLHELGSIVGGFDDLLAYHVIRQLIDCSNPSMITLTARLRHYTDCCLTVTQYHVLWVL